ncbi:MAG: DUF6504 family protein [Calditrichia bacterium]
MTYEEINEPISVITFFQNGKLHPLRFKWKSKVYKITKVNNHWSEQIGLGRQVHFSINAGTSDYFELVFDTGNFGWQLSRLCLEG